MAEVLEFYVPQGNPIRTSKYRIRTTSNGRKQAVAEYKGRKLYRFVPMDFKK